MLPETQQKEVDDVLGEFCRREPPAHVRAQLEYAVRVDGNAVTLVEMRPAFRAEIGRMETPVARFRYVATRSWWELFWRDRNIRWHRYAHVRPAKHLAVLFAEVRRDPTGIFWG
jgi:hypothetical protein